MQESSIEFMYFIVEWLNFRDLECFMDKSLKRVLSGKVIRNKLTLHTRDTTYLAGLLLKKNCSKAQLLLKK